MEHCIMSDARFSLHLKVDIHGGKSRVPFWRRYWQRIVIALSLAAIWIVAKQF